ncbi:type II secretion system F family protein [Pseudoalteromonas sp. C2R02]|uniref:type II secretion system F family protein n=1 Tax=Pseudoalteromonas sp. C2R02 TaxID=2841565 RepID=UPI001C07FF54|nr:type II secretion system F family protein [Pseudoalteromonas sp. C2R02]MBU2969499.1 type II secretion system F family protein [Pseudoalteromonas sp. C2R02]
MAFFTYQAKDSQGKLIKGTLEAANQAAAADSLLKKQCIPMRIVETKKSSDSASFDINDLFEKPVDLEDLIIFSRQMYSLMKAGIPIIRAIIGLAETTTHKRFSETLKDLVVQLEQGRNLSTAMASHKKVFNRLMVSIVMVGESTGKLEDAFEQLATYFEREQETRKQIKSAMRYPIFVIFALVAAMFILNIFVIPTFADMFKKFNAELPLMTRILISTSDFMVNYWGAVLGSMAATGVIARNYIASEVGRLKWDRIKLKIPLVGSIIERSLLSRYCRSFSMILRSGVPMTTGLTLVSEAVDNAHMAHKVIDMRRGIEKGESLLRVSRNSGLFSQLVLQMVAVGEETGQVDELLQESAEFYEREVDFDLKSLTAKIEPILISIVAGMVLVLALGIFTPMWDMMSAIKG